MKLFIIVFAIVGMATNSCTINVNAETVEGNGNIVTRGYDVSAFNEISVSLPAKVNYTVSDVYSCNIRVDENLLDYIEIKVKDRELLLGKKQLFNSTRLNSTQFVIEVSAPSLEELNLASSGAFTFHSPMNVNNLEINLAGSGNVFFKEGTHIGKLELSLASSGSVLFPELSSEEVELDVAGSGSAKIEGGNINELDVSIAGSGSLESYAELTKLEVNIMGSGGVTAKVNEMLKYGIVGSGQVRYYGNPKVEGDKIGSGMVKQINAPKR